MLIRVERDLVDLQPTLAVTLVERIQVDVVPGREVGAIHREIEQHHLPFQGGETHFLTAHHREHDVRQTRTGLRNCVLEQFSLLLLLTAHFQGIHGELVEVAGTIALRVKTIPGGGYRPEHGVIATVVRIKNQEVVDLLEQSIVSGCTGGISQNQFRDFSLIIEQGSV